MKEESDRSIFNPFKDLLSNDIVAKTKSGISDLVSGVKNLFKNEDVVPELPVNNYLKSPDEIETELKIISVQKANFVEKSEAELQPANTGNSLQKTATLPANFHSLEEALSGEMEENY